MPAAPPATPGTAAVGGPAAAAGAETARGWQRELADAVRDPAELCRLLALDPSLAAEAGRSAGGFGLLVPRAFVARMRPGDPRDPLLAQVLPRSGELAEAAGFTADPLDEAAALTAPGLIRKYSGRALVLATGACAVNCRYCFRREFPYADSGATQAGLGEALAAIAADQGIHEVILSGGDPLLLDDGRLGWLVDRINAIGHVRRLRFHTRLPIVLPSRVTAGLTAILAASRTACVVVVHANHAAELDAEVAAAVGRLSAARVILLNQSVLLAGVNDSVDALRALSERLVDLGVVPYYLHLLDRVRGTAHFEVSAEAAVALHERLRGLLPGYAVPRLVREVPGEPAKVWIG
ncbi:MAG: EF-P beta-lysylation protein EpmB [Planctomycetia bacterium]|nr:EF-P beta-lysylation protein EpmB [Planctomycetia bacterium]